jgi:hypothetical protein
MQLDQTHVTIRARTLTEISDLAMVMIRSYPAATFFGFAIGALPWAILNFCLLGWIPIQEFQIASYDEEMESSLFKYQVLMALLVFVQTPAAGVFTTLYIGQAVFESRPPWQSVFREAKESFLRWFWILAVYRGPIPIMAILLCNWGEPESFALDYFWPFLIGIMVLVLRSNRPFIPEIVLLERCPLRAPRDPKAITARRRSVALHRPIAGELFGRFIAIMLVLIGFVGLFLFSLLWVRGVLLGLWLWDAWVYLFLYPLALWGAGALSVLIRFLSYLDTRIRLEGWEVQLAVRAEAIRQFGESDEPPRTAPKSSIPGKPARPSDAVAALPVAASPMVAEVKSPPVAGATP